MIILSICFILRLKSFWRNKSTLLYHRTMKFFYIISFFHILAFSQTNSNQNSLNCSKNIALIIHLKIILINNFRISSFFRQKDRIPPLYCSARPLFMSIRAPCMRGRTPVRTRPKDNRLGVRVLQAPPPHVSNVSCVCAMPALVIDCVYTIIFE